MRIITRDELKAKMDRGDQFTLFEVLPQETGTIGLGWGITGMRAIFSASSIAADSRSSSPT